SPRWRLLTSPVQRVAQRHGIGSQRAFHLQGGPVADIAVEGEIEWRAVEAHLEAGSIAAQRSGEIREADAGGHPLIAPGEAAGGREAARYGWPGERELHSRESLAVRIRLIAQDDRAVLDADLGERSVASGRMFEAAGERFDVTGPVRAAV